MITRLTIAAAATAIVALAGGGAAQADGDPPHATGPCSASAELSNGVAVDPYGSSGPYEIPLSGTATYQGSVDAAVETPRPISGEVVIESPPGIPDIKLTDKWDWSNDESTSLGDSGSVDWDLPSVLPRGVELKVVGHHNDGGGVRCEGYVMVKLEGGVLDSPISWVSFAGTAVTGALLVLSAVSKSGAAVVGGGG